MKTFEDLVNEITQATIVFGLAKLNLSTVTEGLYDCARRVKELEDRVKTLSAALERLAQESIVPRRPDSFGGGGGGAST